jgi:hypothetical protein
VLVMDDTREKLIRLETEFEHLSIKVDEMASQVKEMHGLLMQAKGARWAIVGLATIGGFISAKLTAFLPWAGNLPR